MKAKSCISTSYINSKRIFGGLRSLSFALFVSFCLKQMDALFNDEFLVNFMFLFSLTSFWRKIMEHRITLYVYEHLISSYFSPLFLYPRRKINAFLLRISNISHEFFVTLYFYFFCFPIYFLHFHIKRISREFPGFFPYPFDFSIPGKR